MSTGTPLGPFRQTRIANGVTLDRANAGEVQIQRYVFTHA